MSTFFRSDRAKRFAEAIALPQAALETVQNYPLSESEYLRQRFRYRGDQQEFFDEVLSFEKPLQRMLVLLFCFCEEQWARLCADGIDQTIADQTFRSLRTACEEYHQKSGEWGLENYGWMATHIDGHLLRIGRLQFQPYALEAELRTPSLHLPRGNIVLNIHIPGGEPLDHEACLDSYRRAAHLFPGISPLFYCNSWLLYPGLCDILPASSNIVRFQGDYELVARNDTSRQAEERIWGQPLDNPADYSADNTLRKNSRDYLMSGKTLGRASGIISRYYFE